ncbi:MBL fold metallo-hydrolase [Massilibacteroides sp.]|uniref:MBL fold metallo-hydrolase n=1 Tax=Massilibacteroides sp. TaxID=2034766 RepID=UPI00260ECA78|nr:MBL fold metallo-hydrolase [Massilibacteroides sp.]MDD4514957.1 MBL fold metallo-hydrolase [Massilibacteroides sp.]
MQLTYIYHSCYLLETEKFNLIFDYYKDSGDKPRSGIIHDRILSDKKPLYVFSSHFHPDHFNRDILAWKSLRKDILYIFSKDILENQKAGAGEGLYLTKGEEYKDKNLYVKAFGSTDVGISFYIETEGKTIFHAGDLNNWHWKDESTPEEIKEAEDFYERELNDVAKEIRQLDVAMFPIDPRLGTDFMKGAIQFITRIPVKTLLPMHFGEAYEKIATFNEYAKENGCHYPHITSKGQSINI